MMSRIIAAGHVACSYRQQQQRWMHRMYLHRQMLLRVQRRPLLTRRLPLRLRRLDQYRLEMLEGQ